MAKLENKLFFVNCYTLWRIPCKLMLNTVFKDTCVGEFMNSQFVNIKLNMEGEGEGKTVFTKYKVQAYLTYMILNSNGTEIDRLAGKNSVTGFVAKIEQVLKTTKE